MNIEVIDSHTGGEPTRVIVSGMPALTGQSVAEKLEDFRANYDNLRRGVVCEPRGSDVVVGALLVESAIPTCVAGVIFFNNVGYLGMCGHGTIGVVQTLHKLGRIGTGKSSLETPVGVIEIDLSESGEVSLKNVPSYRLLAGVSVEVPSLGVVKGDVAWGGNWFFLVTDSETDLPALSMENVAELTAISSRIKDALWDAGVTGSDGAAVDHIELFSTSNTTYSNSKNFVLCPGNAYDRSPCGTGTSAKMACLVADGKLDPGAKWVQESITGSTFTGWVDIVDGLVIPNISGKAYTCGKSTLIFDEQDPFRWGID